MASTQKEIPKNLQIGKYIDAMDTVNNWCAGKIWRYLDNNN